MLVGVRVFGSGILGISLLITASAACPAQECTGDCERDGRITVDELIRNIAYVMCPTCPGSACPGFEDGSVAALISAVNNALLGCPDEPLAGVIAQCGQLAKGRSGGGRIYEVQLLVINQSGATITDVTPLELRGGPFTVERSATGRAQVLHDRAARFHWIISSSTDPIVAASATATDGAGQPILIGPVACE